VDWRCLTPRWPAWSSLSWSWAAEAETQHLRVLARLARIFGPEERVEKLRTATGPEALFQMLLDEDARHVY
jgi:mannitol/fructose-specific phosphotransferase system IIA component (Ntr-type)